MNIQVPLLDNTDQDSIIMIFERDNFEITMWYRMAGYTESRNVEWMTVLLDSEDTIKFIS